MKSSTYYVNVSLTLIKARYIPTPLVPLHFSSKDFKILYFNLPNNPTAHYGACHFEYNLALM